MYIDNQLSVILKNNKTLNILDIYGVNKVTQVFPDESSDLSNIYIINVDPSKLDIVLSILSLHNDVESCSKIPRKKIQ